MGEKVSITLEEAYRRGKSYGLGIGEENARDFGRYDFEQYMDECTEHERNVFRQYSPFEFLARDLNDHPDPDLAWERYEAGVAVGLRQAWRESGGVRQRG